MKTAMSFDINMMQKYHGTIWNWYYSFREVLWDFVKYSGKQKLFLAKNLVRKMNFLNLTIAFNKTSFRITLKYLQ